MISEVGHVVFQVQGLLRARTCRIAKIFAGLTISVPAPTRVPTQSRVRTTVGPQLPRTIRMGGSNTGTGFPKRRLHVPADRASILHSIPGKATETGPSKFAVTGPTTRDRTANSHPADRAYVNAAGYCPAAFFVVSQVAAVLSSLRQPDTGNLPGRNGSVLLRENRYCVWFSPIRWRVRRFANQAVTCLTEAHIPALSSRSR